MVIQGAVPDRSAKLPQAVRCHIRGHGAAHDSKLPRAVNGARAQARPHSLADLPEEPWRLGGQLQTLLFDDIVPWVRQFWQLQRFAHEIWKQLAALDG